MGWLKKNWWKIAGVLVVLICVGWAGLELAFRVSTSEGTAVGQVIKFNRSGMLFKTWECQIDLGLFANQQARHDQTGMQLYMFDCSLTDRKLADEIEDIHDHGERIVAHYTKRGFTLPWHGETTYIVDRVEPEKQR